MKKIIILVTISLTLNAYASIDWGTIKVNQKIKNIVKDTLTKKCNNTNMNIYVSYIKHALWFGNSISDILLTGSDAGGAIDYEMQIILLNTISKDADDALQVFSFNDIERTCL